MKLQEKSTEFQKRGASVAAISVDPAEKSEKVISDLKLGFPLLSDPGREVIRKFGVEDAENEIAWPVVFIVDPQGKVRWRGPLESFKKRPPAEEILAQLDKMKGA